MPPARRGEVTFATRNRLAAFDAASGNLSIAFKLVVYNGAGNFATVLTMDVSADGAVLYLGGHLTAVSGVARHHLAAVRASGGGLEGWTRARTASWARSAAEACSSSCSEGAVVPISLTAYRCRQP